MRGVNKLVLELKPDDDTFEKAILFLKPEKAVSSQKELSDKAEHIIYSLGLENDRKERKRISPAVFLLTGIAAGSAISWTLIYLIGVIG